MNCISLTLYTLSTIKLFIDMLNYFPLLITRFDEMDHILHLVSQQEVIRSELFWLRLTQHSGSISPKVA